MMHTATSCTLHGLRQNNVVPWPTVLTVLTVSGSMGGQHQGARVDPRSPSETDQVQKLSTSGGEPKGNGGKPGEGVVGVVYTNNANTYSIYQQFVVCPDQNGDDW